MPINSLHLVGGVLGIDVQKGIDKGRAMGMSDYEIMNQLKEKIAQKSSQPQSSDQNFNPNQNVKIGTYNVPQGEIQKMGYTPEQISQLQKPITSENRSTLGNLAVGAGKEALKLGSYVAKPINQALSGLPSLNLLGVTPEQAKQSQNTVDKMIQPRGVAQNIGAIGTDIAVSSPLIGGASGLIEKGASKLGTVIPGLSESPFLNRVLKGVGTVGKGAAKSAASTSIITPIATGKSADIYDYLSGGAIDLATSGVGTLLKKIAPGIFQLGTKVSGPKFGEIDTRAAEATGKYMGTARQIVSDADNVIKNNSEKLNSLLKDHPQTWMRSDFASNVNDAIQTAKNGGFKAEAKAMEGYAKDFISANKKPLNAQQVLELKRNLADKVSSLFQSGKSADPSIAAKKVAIVKIWQSLDDALNSVSPEVAKANREMTVAYSIKGPLSDQLKKGPLAGISLSSLSSTLRGIPGSTTVSSYGAAGTKAIGKALSNKNVPVGLKGLLSKYRQSNP